MSQLQIPLLQAPKKGSHLPTLTLILLLSLLSSSSLLLASATASDNNGIPGINNQQYNHLESQQQRKELYDDAVVDTGIAMVPFGEMMSSEGDGFFQPQDGAENEQLLLQGSSLVYKFLNEDSGGFVSESVSRGNSASQHDSVLPMKTLSNWDSISGNNEQEAVDDAAEVCQWKAHTPLPYNQLVKCLQKLPFQASVATSTLHTLQELSKMYVYREILKDSPEPYHKEIDLDERFEIVRKRIRDNVYENDLQFQSDLQKIFIDVKDAHTIYAPPRCFTSFYFYLPFPLASGILTATGEQVVLVDKYSSSYSEVALNYTKVYPEQAAVVSNFTGWRVLQIDGMDAIEYLNQYGNEFVSYSFDAGVRFNYLLKSAWSTRNLMRDLVPPSGYVTYTLQHLVHNTTQNVTVQFFGKNSYNIDSDFGLLKRCGYSNSVRKNTISESQSQSITASGMEFALNKIWKTYQWYKQPYYQLSHSLSEHLDTVFGEDYQRLKRLVQPNRESQFTNSLPSKDAFDTLLDSFSAVPQVNIPAITHQLLHDASHSAHFRAGKEFKLFEEQQNRSTRSRAPLSAASSPEYDTLYTSPRKEFIVLKKRGSNTGVLRVTTFMPDITLVSNPDDVSKAFTKNPLKAYMERLQKATRVLAENKISKLIVDVRGNTGGVVCYGWMLAWYLSPYTPRDPSPNADQIYSQIQNQMQCPTNIITKINQGYAETRSTLPDNWFSDGPTLERGGSSAKYSKKFILGCQLAMLITDVDYTYRPEIQYEPSDLLVLTDGTCGSTCGMFVQLVQYLNLGKVVAQGGLKNQDLAVASFKGAAVMLSDNFFSQQSVSLCPVETSQRIKKFPSNALMTWSWLEAYPWSPRIGAFELSKADTSVPMEFLKVSPSARLFDWSLAGTNQTYEKILPAFDRCMKWEVKKSAACTAPFENAISGHPCIYDESLGYGVSFDNSKCVLSRCTSNYYLNEAETECLRMPDPFDGLSVVITLLVWLVIVFTCFFVFCCCCCTGCCALGAHGITRCLTKQKVPRLADDYHRQLDEHELMNIE